MKKETYEKCLKWDKVFRNAIKLNFIHLSASEFGEIALIYAEHFGKTLTASQMGCNSCRLRSLKELGQDYLKQAEEEKKKEEEQPKKNKGGRPKKIVIE